MPRAVLVRSSASAAAPRLHTAIAAVAAVLLLSTASCLLVVPAAAMPTTHGAVSEFSQAVQEDRPPGGHGSPPSVVRGPPASPWFYDVVLPPAGPVGIQLDPHTLRVVDSTIPPTLSLPGTIANVAIDDRLVAVNGRSLAYLPFADVKKLLAQTDGDQPRARTLRFATMRNPLERPSALDIVVPLNGAEALGVHLSVHDLTVESFVRPNGDTADATTVQSAMESLAQAGDPTSAARTGAFGQALASGAILPGDRIVHVAGQPLLGLTPRKGLEALRSVFVPKKTEEVRCRGPKYAVYCSVEQLPRTIRPTSIAVRPAVNSAFRERVPALAQEPRATSGVSGAVAAVTRMRAALQEAETSRAHGATPDLSPSAFPSPDVGTVTVINHKGDATSLPFRGALFGGDFKCGLFRLVAADPPSACQELYNAEDLRGAVVLVRRGDCFFESKGRQVQQAGGSAVIVYNVHERDPAVRMPSGDGTATDVVIAAGMVDAAGGTRLQDVLRQARSAHHVATGDGGSVWVLFSAPGACEEDVKYHTGADVAEAEEDVNGGGLGAAAASEGDDGGLWVGGDSTAGASALLNALLSQQQHGRQGFGRRVEVADDAGDVSTGDGE